MTENEHCIEDCLEASELCEQAAGHCLRRGGARAESDLVDALVLAAAAGSCLAELIRSESVLTGPMSEYLADACRRAAAACRVHPGDELLASCADACDRCAACAPRTLGGVARSS